MGSGRAAYSLCHCGPPATIVAADDVSTGRLLRGQCGFVAVAVGVVSRSIPPHHRSSPHQHPSGGKWREEEVVPLSKKAAVMTSEPCPLLGSPTPNPSPVPSPLAFTHTLLPWQRWPFTPLLRLLHLLSIKWTGAFSPTSVIYTLTKVVDEM